MADQFQYVPEWQGPLSGRSFEKQTQDVINVLLQGQASLEATATPSQNGLMSAADKSKLDGFPSVSDLSTDLAGKVSLTGDESIAGAKTFAEGPYGTASAMDGEEIDLATGSVFTKTVTADADFTITGAPAGTAASFAFVLTDGGSYTVTWPASVLWAGGTAPVLTASGTDVLAFLTPDGGTTWYGRVLVQGAA